MNIEQLEKLVDIVNKELSEGKSLKSLLKKFGVQKKDFNKIKYSYNADIKQFTKDTKEVHKEIQEVKSVEVSRNNKFIDENIEILKRMIKKFKEHEEVENNDLNIQLPYDENKNFKISMRVNEEVWKIFKEFCNNHTGYTQKDLVSQALLDYAKRHK